MPIYRSAKFACDGCGKFVSHADLDSGSAIILDASDSWLPQDEVICGACRPEGDNIVSDQQKVVTLCGSSKFTDIMAVCAWIIERDENKIAMGLHLLPDWYPDGPPDHLAEHEGVADQMDALHLKKIDLSAEVFVVNFNDYIGESTTREIAHAVSTGKPVRYFMSDAVGVQVLGMMKAAHEKEQSS